MISVLRILIATTLTVLLYGGAQATDWPMFRGPDGQSVAPTADLPLQWSVEDGTNIAWEVDLPGRGVSGPIVVDGKVIVTSSSGARRNRLHVAAFDSTSGKRLWHRQFWATGRTLCHETSAVAAPTPASDGEQVFAFFSSNDLIALDLEGNLLWMRGLALDYPGAGNDVGMSSSPVIAGDIVVVQSEASGKSFAAALDVANGATRWELERPKQANWVSPIAIPGESKGAPPASVVLQSARGVSAHHPGDGQLMWELPLSCDTITSLVFNKLLYVPADGLQVFDVLGGKAAGVDDAVWRTGKLHPSSASPVVVDGFVLALNSAGVLTCGQLATKEILWRKRLGGRFWATPVLAGNHLYCINADGHSYVVELGDEGRIVAESDFGEPVLASPAVADDALYVRGYRRLWKIAKPLRCE